MRFVVILSILLLAVAGIATANVPARVPVQGYLTDTAGIPIDGPVQIEIRLYDVQSGGTAWYAETQVVTVDNGELTAYVGSVMPLDMTQFRGATPYVGITLAGESEMTPRLALGSVPYAAYAQETAAVPTGAVMMFDLTACPPGWAELTGARGRALVGLPVGGTLAGTVGTALGDLEDRAHAHVVDPDPVQTGVTGAHNHSINPPSATTQFTDVAHTHSVDPPSHQHRWASYAPNGTTSRWATYSFNDTSSLGAVALVDWSDGMDSAGTGNYPLEVDFTATTSSIFYTQMTDQGAFTSGAPSTSLNHNHTFDMGSFTHNSFADGAHDHAVNVGMTTSLGASTGQVIPYLQLLTCRKN